MESRKRSKQDAMSRMVRMCVNAVFNVATYSYFRDDLNDSDARKGIKPLDIMYSRPLNKWDRVMLLVMDQAKVIILEARPIIRTKEHLSVGVAC